MANLIINRTREVEIGTETLVKGMWKLEVVCPNGEIKKPFGDEWRPNLLMRRGLQQLVGGLAGALDHQTSIAALMNMAMYGNVITSPTDRTFNSGIAGSPAYASITNDTQVGIFGYSSFSSVGGAGNTVTDNLNTGSRIFQKTYDFLATPNVQTVKEILITDHGATQTRGSGLPPTVGYGNGDILSRFILPSPVVLAQYQFLRLTYALQVTIPAITAAGEINIDVQSGSFNGLGKLRCFGSFNNIFGRMDANGSPLSAQIRNTCGGSTESTRDGKVLPWSMVGIRTGATLVPGGDSAGTSQFPLPTVGDNLSTAYTKQPSSEHVFSDGAGGSTTDLGLSNGNLSWTRGATLLFPATNPNLSDQYIGGITFVSLGNLSAGGCGPYMPNNFDLSGWYWRFTDIGGSPRGQLKDINFALAVNITSTASIT
jgi:hypothetical protein